MFLIDKRCSEILKSYTLLFFHSKLYRTVRPSDRGTPGVWNGPPVVLYRSFNTLAGLGLMAGAFPSNFEALKACKPYE